VLENLLVVPGDQTGERLWAPWLAPHKIRREETHLRAEAERVLQQVGLTRVAQDPAWTLSGGQKKLLELARALMADPKLLMLDEPGAGVNPTQMKELTRYIQWLASERGVTILLIEHDMDLVMSVCNPVIVLSEGRPLVEGPPETVRRDPRVLAAYLGTRQR
jgi:branched-chain amino acid transport system ATP-binding protein